MKKSMLMLMLIGLLCTMSVSVQAQGLYTPATAGYTPGSTASIVKVYGPFQDATSVVVGVYYTKGASEDSTSTVQVLHSLNSAAITAGYGEVISTDATLQFGNSAASEYQEQVISRVLPGYIGIKIKPVGTATDTTNIKPFIYIK